MMSSHIEWQLTYRYFRSKHYTIFVLYKIQDDYMTSNQYNLMMIDDLYITKSQHTKLHTDFITELSFITLLSRSTKSKRKFGKFHKISFDERLAIPDKALSV